MTQLLYFKILSHEKFISPECQNVGADGTAGKDYKGSVARTISGRVCQKWSEQKPHRHQFKEVGKHNFCRNPDEEPGVWCYTMDKRKRWELCDVPKCDKGVNQQDFTHGLCLETITTTT